MSAAERSTRDRGEERLLWDCATVGHWLEIDESPARARLDAELGDELAAFLLTTLQQNEPSAAFEQRLTLAAGPDSDRRLGPQGNAA